jgi:hypothetical protein
MKGNFKNIRLKVTTESLRRERNKKQIGDLRDLSINISHNHLATVLCCTTTKAGKLKY